jgi:hypothetical protein
MQRVIIEYSLQNRSNSGVPWLPWPSRIKSRYTPLVRCAVCFSNTCSSHLRPNSLSVQPFSLTAITQSEGRVSEYHVDICTLPSKIITGGTQYPYDEMQSIAVTYSRLLGCTETGLDFSAPVITLAIKITPI